MAWTVYNNGTKRTQYSTVPTSSVIAQSVVVDGVAVSNCDHAGITTTQSRQFTSTGMTLVQTDGRGNATTTVTDLAGRMVSVTDATNAATTTVYEATSDNPACITNAQGKTTCYRYDLRGQKVAEWGTAIQPACFGYDDADRLVSLTTFRANEADITTDPTERTDGDITTWSYDPASGQELCKTYADNSAITKTYDSFGRLATETNARGMVKTLSYVLTTGELSGMVWEDDAAHAQAFTYTLTGKLASVTDAAGMRTFTYNEYDELVSDSLTALDKSHLITEHRDEFGRSVGYDYKLNGIVQQSVNYGYGTDGRYSTAGFTHGGTNKQFQYGYFAGSNLLQTLTMPNGITLTQQYEQQRDLLTGMSYMRGETTVAERTYAYDTLGRPTSRTETREGDATRSDAFTHNDRSELTAATLGNAAYAYAYDNIGNRKSAQENAEEVTNYDTNNLNQYTAVGEFVPEFDADGNQTKVQTSTGIWNVTYDAENRPTVFSRANDDGTTTQVTCAYDYKGRRATKKVETLTTNAETGESSSAINLNHAYIYRGYLQITCFDLQPVPYPCLWHIAWDPSQSVATRPLAIQMNSIWYCYGWDLTKNICEVFGADGLTKTAYSYMPFGAVTASGSVTQSPRGIGGGLDDSTAVAPQGRTADGAAVSQPIQWSSEFFDDELGLVYYNYRHYNAEEGRWINRDPIVEKGGQNIYWFTKNSPDNHIDRAGLCAPGMQAAQAGSSFTPERLAASNTGQNLSDCFAKCPKNSVYRKHNGCCQYKTKVPRPGYTPPYNGCGAAGGWKFWDKFDLIGPEFDFTTACNNHDICYGTCGSVKSECDDKFFDEMKSACLRAMGGYGDSLIMLVECDLAAHAYYEAVVVRGYIPYKRPYEEAQAAACVEEWKLC